MLRSQTLPEIEDDNEDDMNCERCNVRCCEDTLQTSQVTDQNVISPTRKVQGHNRKFCVEWYKKFLWLVLCITTFRVFCSYCHYCYRRGLLTDKLGEAAFVTIG